MDSHAFVRMKWKFHVVFTQFLSTCTIAMVTGASVCAATLAQCLPTEIPVLSGRSPSLPAPVLRYLHSSLQSLILSVFQVLHLWSCADTPFGLCPCTLWLLFTCVLLGSRLGTGNMLGCCSTTEPPVPGLGGHSSWGRALWSFWYVCNSSCSVTG